MRVFLTGASGTGKSTIASHVLKKNNLHRLRSVTEQVLENYGFSGSADDFVGKEVDPDEWQESLFATLIDLQHNAGDDYVTDRTVIDVLAYSGVQSTVAWKIFRSEEFRAEIELMKELTSFVFYVEPSERCLEQARKEGRRDRWLTTEVVWRVDGIIKFLLEAHDVNYFPITTADLDKRKRLVDAVLLRMKKL